MNDLKEMLSYCRPAWSSMEDQFIERYISPLNPEVDPIGNQVVTVGEKPRVLWSCHTDTVHKVGLRQKVKLDKKGRWVAGSKHSNCLGGDDTCGVWLALELIRAGISGTYVFHRAEEIGCIGAKHIVKNNQELLKAHEVSIALDRRGQTSLVSAQSGQVCCSDVFAQSLCEELAMGHQPDSGGIWTDNVEYIDYIPEIVNLSVGYEGAHQRHESVDSVYLNKLLEALKGVAYEKLPIHRDPNIVEYTAWGSGYSTGEWEWDSKTPRKDQITHLAELIRDYPESIAKMLWEYGFDEDDVLDALVKAGDFFDSDTGRWDYAG